MWGGSIQRAKLIGAHLEVAILGHVTLADERGIGPIVVDAQWNNTNFAIVNWTQVKMLGDEYRVQQTRSERKKERGKVLKYLKMAVRANRQISVALQSQGLNEEGARFAYRAQKLQRVVLWHQKKLGQYIFSLFLDALAGYGYRPGRSVIWYLVMIFGFALTYHIFGGLTFFPSDAIVFSIMSFHGRGFFPNLSSETNLHNPLVMLAAAEAIIGLFIEISFITTFTQRFFGK